MNYESDWLESELNGGVSRHTLPAPSNPIIRMCASSFVSLKTQPIAMVSIVEYPLLIQDYLSLRVRKCDITDQAAAAVVFKD